MPLSGARQRDGLSNIEQLTAIEPLIGSSEGSAEAEDCCHTRNRPFMRGVNHETRKAVFFRPRCGMWDCPSCAEDNKGMWAVRAFHGVEVLAKTLTEPQGNLISFLTLTSHPNLSATASLLVFPHAWSQLRKRARRSAPQGQFLMVLERHKDARIHAHAIETFNLSTRWWKDNSAECGLGYIAEEEELRSAGGGAFYTVKYITKSLNGLPWPKGTHRVQTSRGWPKLPPLSGAEDWLFSTLARREALADAVDRLEQLGYDVVVCTHKEAWRIVNPPEPE
jgi:hypothetical protein